MGMLIDFLPFLFLGFSPCKGHVRVLELNPPVCRFLPSIQTSIKKCTNDNIPGGKTWNDPGKKPCQEGDSLDILIWSDFQVQTPTGQWRRVNTPQFASLCLKTQQIPILQRQSWKLEEQQLWDVSTLINACVIVRHDAAIFNCDGDATPNPSEIDLFIRHNFPVKWDLFSGLGDSSRFSPSSSSSSFFFFFSFFFFLSNLVSGYIWNFPPNLGGPALGGAPVATAAATAEKYKTETLVITISIKRKMMNIWFRAISEKLLHHDCHTNLSDK